MTNDNTDKSKDMNDTSDISDEDTDTEGHARQAFGAQIALDEAGTQGHTRYAAGRPVKLEEADTEGHRFHRFVSDDDAEGNGGSVS